MVETMIKADFPIILVTARKSTSLPISLLDVSVRKKKGYGILFFGPPA